MSYLGNSPGVSSQRVATTFTATAGQTAFNPVGGYTLGYTDVYLNGVKLIDGVDFTAADGVTITLVAGAALNDNLETLCYTPHGLSDGYTKPEADARYQATSNGSIDVTGTVTAAAGIFTTADINAGTIDGTTIGATTPASVAATTLSTTGAATFSANVGIGTNSPSVNTEIRGSASNGQLRLGGSTTATYANIYSDNDGVLILGADAGNNAANSYFGVEVDGAERMRIDASGKLLIGDSASQTADLLQIETPASGGGHGIQIRRNDSNTDQGVGRIQFGNNTATDLASISAKTDGAADNGALLFNTSVSGGANTERLRIDSSGNLGLGVTPSAWAGTSNGSMDFGAALVGAVNADLQVGVNISMNMYWNGAAWTNKSASYATSYYNQSNDGHEWYYNTAAALGTFTPTRRMKLDASGNLLVGKSAANYTAAGVMLEGDGTISSVKAGTTGVFNRLTSVGDIITFRKDGASVGSIGVGAASSYLAIGNNNTSIQFYASGIAPATGSPSTLSDNTKDLGAASVRFKDLYLSGNANVGSVVASGSVVSPFFTTGSFSYSSGTTSIITIPANSTYLFMARPNNYGGGDSRHGSVYIIRRWGGHVSNAVQLASSANGLGEFTVTALGTVSYGNTGGGIPATAIYWMRIG
jgi:hypothetical protein